MQARSLRVQGVGLAVFQKLPAKWASCLDLRGVKRWDLLGIMVRLTSLQVLIMMVVIRRIMLLSLYVLDVGPLLPKLLHAKS